MTYSPLCQGKWSADNWKFSSNLLKSFLNFPRSPKFKKKAGSVCHRPESFNGAIHRGECRKCAGWDISSGIQKRIDIHRPATGFHPKNHQRLHENQPLDQRQPSALRIIDLRRLPDGHLDPDDRFHRDRRPEILRRCRLSPFRIRLHPLLNYYSQNYYF